MTESNTRPPWLTELFRAIDAKDARQFSRFFANDGCFAFSGTPEVVGREAVESFVAGFFESISSLSHELDRVWQSAGRGLVCEGRVTYTRHDGSQLQVPFCNVYQLEEQTSGGLIRDYRVYGDFSQLHG